MIGLGGVAIAGGASLALNISYLIQSHALAGTPSVSLRHPVRTVATLLRSPRWVAGALLSYVGLALNITAMAVAPLWVVQATLACGLAIASACWSRLGGRPLTTGQKAALLLLAGGVVALGHGGQGAHAGVHASVATLALLGILAGAGAVALLRDHGPSVPWRLGLAAGILYGTTTVALASLVSTVTAAQPRVPVILAALALGALSVAGGFLAFQRGLQTAATSVVTLMTAAMNAVAMLGGLLLGRGLSSVWIDRSWQLAGLVMLCAASGLAAGALNRAPVRRVAAAR
jgi:drug/metabolite transporter (DMT)-like permease